MKRGRAVSCRFVQNQIGQRDTGLGGAITGSCDTHGGRHQVPCGGLDRLAKTTTCGADVFGLEALPRSKRRLEMCATALLATFSHQLGCVTRQPATEANKATACKLCNWILRRGTLGKVFVFSCAIESDIIPTSQFTASQSLHSLEGGSSAAHGARPCCYESVSLRKCCIAGLFSTVP